MPPKLRNQKAPLEDPPQRLSTPTDIRLGELDEDVRVVDRTEDEDEIEEREDEVEDSRGAEGRGVREEGVTRDGGVVSGGGGASEVPPAFEAFIQAMTSMMGRVEPRRVEREMDRFTLSPRETIKEIPSFKEGGDLSKYVRGLEAELAELKLPKQHWKTVLLSKLPPKVKDTVVEAIEAGATYAELKGSLLKRVGRSLRELELDVFPQRRRVGKDRVERVKEVIRTVERVSMLCPSRNDIKLFLARGMFCAELTQTECGMVGGQTIKKMDDLVEAACLLRETSQVRGREESKPGGPPK